MRRIEKAGFTMVELVIVIAVIALLAAVVIPTFSGAGEQANEGAGFENCTMALQNVIAQQSDSTIGTAYFIYNGHVYKYENKQLSATDETTLTVAEKTGDTDEYKILYYTTTIHHVVVYLPAGDVEPANGENPCNEDIDLSWSVPQGSWSSESSDMKVSLK